MPINWCNSCKVGLANEEVIQGTCERCGGEVVRKEKNQWMLKITEYADRLIDDLDLVNYIERVKIQQKNWIGRSYGMEIKFPVDDTSLTVFTTRPDTLYGVTYATVAPEHPLVDEIILKENPSLKEFVDKMINEDKINRTAEDKEKEGVFSGLYVVNPVNNEKVPLWVANYVLMDYGTGGVMAVPAHDERDFQFSKKYNLPIKVVILPVDENGDIKEVEVCKMTNAYKGEGIFNKFRRIQWNE